MAPDLTARGRLYVDSRAAAVVESGDIVLGVREGRFGESHIVGELGDKTAVDALMTLVKDASPDVRRRALHALGELRDTRAIATVTSALKDQDVNVRRAAAFALAELAGGE